MYFKRYLLTQVFISISVFGFLVYIVLAFFSYHTAHYISFKVRDDKQNYSDSDLIKSHSDTDFKYILLWTTRDDRFLASFGEGQDVFLKSKCAYVNCYMTTDKNLLDNATEFDAVVLNLKTVMWWKKNSMPKIRSAKQKYVFYSHEPASDNVVCKRYSDNYFNWTWTYKLNSNIIRPFIEVKEFNGHVIGHNLRPDWSISMQNQEANVNISGKTKALAWIMNDCDTIKNRHSLVNKLKQAIAENNLVFDMFGCDQKHCPENGCGEIIQKDYYFYLAIEVAKVEDYVTAEVLKAYDNYAVPIVIGGADYSKFLPPGSYIDANQYSVENIVDLMKNSIENPELYSQFHIWRKHYTIATVEPSRGVCDLCEYLNDREKMQKISVYEFFRSWWYFGPLHEVCHVSRNAQKYRHFSYSKLTHYNPRTR